MATILLHLWISIRVLLKQVLWFVVIDIHCFPISTTMNFLKALVGFQFDSFDSSLQSGGLSESSTNTFVRLSFGG